MTKYNSSFRVGFLIPAFNPTESLLDVVRGLKKLIAEKGIAPELFPILIIDDGSTKEESLDIFKTLKKEGFKTLIQPNNQGKGGAIKVGLTTFSSQEPDLAGVCTLDADGQHVPDDALNLVDHFIENGACSLTLGVRSFKENMPLRSKFGNVFTQKVFRVLSGKQILDTQTGLRIIPQALFVDFIQIKSEKYDFEMEALLHATSKKFPVEQIPIQTIYEEGNPSSHFNPLGDSILIYFVFLRYLAGVSLAAFLDYLGFYLLISLNKSVFFSLVVARSVSIFVYFALARKMIFQSEEKPVLKFFQFLPLAVFNVFYVNLFIGYYQSYLGGSAMLSKLVSELTFFMLNFLLQRFVIFPKVNQNKPTK
jgi:glycosyltransferase involved in cell wall biosynthesis